MSAADSFFDTNVLLYLLSKDAAKADLAEALLATGGVVSVQVLNEFASVATRKLAMTIPEIREILSTIRAVCVVRSLDIETHDLGLEMAERYGFSIYDGLIVAAAVRAGCAILYTEDLQQGQVIDQLTIQNPFAGSWCLCLDADADPIQPLNKPGSSSLTTMPVVRLEKKPRRG